MKVYLVHNSYGSYHDSSINIDKVFDSKVKAEQYVEEVLNRMYDLKSIFRIYKSSIDDQDYDIYKKAVEKFNSDFPDTCYDDYDGNTFKIIEMGVE